VGGGEAARQRRREAGLRAQLVRIGGGVNEEAITRVWPARRDARGAFLSCDAPTGDENDWLSQRVAVFPRAQQLLDANS